MQDVSSLHAFNFNHLPVLANEVVEWMNEIPKAIRKEGVLIDATIGGGGHSALLLKSFPEIRVIGIDQDPIARAASSEHLKEFGNRVEIVDANFGHYIPRQKVMMVLADLGISSHQLDTPLRGFSFQSNGPIDMRMNPINGVSAENLIEQLDENSLADIIYNFGEERLSRRIARRIKKDLKENGAYKGTKDLAYAIAGCYPPKLRKSRIHPATKTFQALRIAVNNELEALDTLLLKGPDWLISGGLLGIISFHSLEDRRVKNAFKSDDRLERLTKKPITAAPEETSKNPRSRSAKLRVSKKK
ncbi:16S rRNA (cytosine(1402)-N(4))-methyltransferase RsmH [Prochlorococcus sp. MIT 1223]|uniref:16S rRNA (cytosine(1402)-N(4))-methyltransferase RsmH n=1 Tax=Prochlorococcus sp. MIT 1223 TaxID=3096217 RepID=UPI002A7652CE|nr:16S rRNA (cytosine(1402)-N(4))-methyltransferase RsmH [Prochlorococcus sp. MIT 1223]